MSSIAVLIGGVIQVYAFLRWTSNSACAIDKKACYPQLLTPPQPSTCTPVPWHLRVIPHYSWSLQLVAINTPAVVSPGGLALVGLLVRHQVFHAALMQVPAASGG